MEVEVWERQPAESNVAFEAFAVYRDLGLKRSIRSAAAALGKSPKLLERWSARWEWKRRTEAFDSHMDRISTKAQEEARREMNERQVKTGMAMQEKASQYLDQVNPADLTPAQAARLIEAGVKIERQARGEPPQEPEGQVQVIRLPLRAKTTEEWVQWVKEEEERKGGQK